MSLPIYNQWGGPWSGVKLGNSEWTMANSGCYTTSLTMILNNYGYRLNPMDVVSKLNADNGYQEGMMQYAAVERQFPQVYFHKRVDTTNHPAQNISKEMVGVSIERIKRLVGAGLYPILCVDNLYNDKWPDHAVVCTEAPDDLREWVILNPDGGKEQKFLDKYGPVEKNLYGYVAFIGPPISATKDISLGIAAWKAKEIDVAVRRNDYQKASVYARELVDSIL